MAYLIVAIACSIIGYFIGKNKGHGALGLILGLLLGVIGLIIVAILRPAAGHPAGAPSGEGMGREMAKVETVEARLSRLDQLLASGALTADEHSAQRQRMLGEL